MRLLVRNMSRNTTEKELRDLFETFGSVQSCVIVNDAETGTSKGFGFVEMPKSGDAKAAMLRLNGQRLGGEAIRVKRAK
ncbi:MAG: RNA-binding protein [Acidimicrobiaceae bacterium]|jgi:RNA recognition motif-containing protein|nr:RNA-binding protein [Acidimicrobiaceae bacterium]MBT5579287.1 RNA-binding protein [Acidimicrobiaceae bacterium]MBT5852266.1 RNA-binding protein [Acidimicrobiaceae bacterium]MDG1411046.1 RNA-binding protein [Acidimicrobiales bacterium]MDG2217695.1 RNA-binding protein [Acidimicrobiales bacterium]